GRTGTRPRRGTRRLASGRGADGDLDIDRTLERLAASRPPDPADLVTRHWAASRRAICLAVDASGSMGGRAVSVAAVAAASVVLAEDRADPSVLAFAGDVTVLQVQDRRREPADVVGDLIGLRGHGVTNLAEALRSASRQLATAHADERTVVLLSDCLPTAGDDPVRALAGIDRLHVLCPAGKEDARRAAAELSARGNGRWQPVDGLGSVAPALTGVLA
ncbi:MAG: VWA domain-containing protein, partial [Streptosporangiaceae bacterium]